MPWKTSYADEGRAIRRCKTNAAANRRMEPDRECEEIIACKSTRSTNEEKDLGNFAHRMKPENYYGGKEALRMESGSTD